MLGTILKGAKQGFIFQIHYENYRIEIKILTM